VTTVTFSVCAQTSIQKPKKEKYKTKQKRTNMETNQKIAEITLEIKKPRVRHATFHEKRLRLKCQPCAIFCCKLGGPKLSERDIQRLKQIRNNAMEFLDTNGCVKNCTPFSRHIILTIPAENHL